MAKDGRPPPQQQPGELPRRVRGASNARIPTQIRRGYLPDPSRVTGDAAQGSSEDAAALVSLPALTLPGPKTESDEPAESPAPAPNPMLVTGRPDRGSSAGNERAHSARAARNWRRVGILIAIAVALIAAVVLTALMQDNSSANSGKPLPPAGQRRIAAENLVCAEFAAPSPSRHTESGSCY